MVNGQSHLRIDFLPCHRPEVMCQATDDSISFDLEDERDSAMEGPYLAASHSRFESLPALEAALASPGMAQLEADGEHVTNVAARAHISEIVT